MRKAVVFLTNKPQEETLKFAEEVYLKTDFEVFVVVDDNDFNCEEKKYSFKFIQVKDQLCAYSGYAGANIDENSTHIKKKVIAYDKMLFHFCVINKEFDFLWVFEEDVFIPSIETIKNLDEKYSQHDLVTSNHIYNNGVVLDWHWKTIINKIEAPYYHSMVCAAGFSKKMLQCVTEFVGRKKTLFHIEALFNTLAAHNYLSVCVPLELKSIVFMGEWNMDHFLLLPNNVFHPVKDIENYQLKRTDIGVAKKQKYKPSKKSIPKFIKDFMKNYLVFVSLIIFSSCDHLDKGMVVEKYYSESQQRYDVGLKMMVVEPPKYRLVIRGVYKEDTLVEVKVVTQDYFNICQIGDSVNFNNK